MGLLSSNKNLKIALSFVLVFTEGLIVRSNRDKEQSVSRIGLAESIDFV